MSKALQLMILWGFLATIYLIIEITKQRKDKMYRESLREDNVIDDNCPFCNENVYPIAFKCGADEEIPIVLDLKVNPYFTESSKPCVCSSCGGKYIVNNGE